MFRALLVYIFLFFLFFVLLSFFFFWLMYVLWGFSGEDVFNFFLDVFKGFFSFGKIC